MADLEIEKGRTCLRHQVPTGRLIEKVGRNGKTRRVRETESVPLYLVDLKPNAGRGKPIDMPDCGSLCDIKYADMLHNNLTLLTVNFEGEQYVWDTKYLGDYEKSGFKRVWKIGETVIEGTL